LKIANDLIKEANASIEEEEFDTIKSQVGEYAQEL
jgi:amyloid beta precursor protein binding protein 1